LVAGFEVEVIDTTGAADSFVGGLYIHLSKRVA